MEFYKSAEEYYSDMTSNIDHVDNSEHSLIYSSDMPVAYELSKNSLALQELTKRIHARSAYLNGYIDELEKFCEDVGIYMHKKTYAEGTAYVTRQSVQSVPAIRKAKNAIRKAFENSLAGKGSNLVEIVSTCSSGWKMTPQKSNEWMQENMFPYYPLGDLKDKE